MKRLIIPILLSMVFHALVMGLDTSWLKFRSQGRPHHDQITISLAALQPKGDEKALKTTKLPEKLEKVETTIKKTEPPVPAQVVNPAPEEPKQAAKPVAPPPEPIPPQKMIEQETAVKQEAPQKKIASKHEFAVNPIIPPLKKEVPKKKIKPKKSLKRLTKKPQKAISEKKVAKGKPIETPKPVIGADAPRRKKTTSRQVKSPSNIVEPPNQIKPQPKFGKESTPKDMSVKESAAMATKGDTAAATGLIMARPLYRKNPPPKYPRRARRKGHQGNVILEVLIDEKGNVMELKLFKSSGYESLDRSALSSVQKWLFEPGTRNGEPAKMWVRVPVRFQLK